MVGLVTTEPIPKGFPDLAPCTVCTHHVFCADLEFFSCIRSGRAPQGHSQWVLICWILGFLEPDVFVAIVRFHPCRSVFHEAVKMINDARLRNEHHGPLAVFFWQFANALFTHDMLRVFWVWLPKGHVGDGVSFFVDFVGESESLEGFHGARMHTISIS